MAIPLLEVKDLKKYYPITKGFFKKKIGNLRAVDGVSFVIDHGETFGLVGESGCGKTTLGRCILQTIRPSSGKIVIEGRESLFDTRARPKSLSAKIQAVFQDPYSSLNPRQKIRDIILEPLVIQGDTSVSAINERLENLYELIGLEKDIGDRYPHMLSGGQQQRVCIARAMIVQPRFVVCDEPVASLDVSIRAQILNLFKSLQKRLQVSYLFISHDLSVVHYISDVVAVMYLGKIVEISPKAELYNNPLHSYTRALLSAIPIPDPIVLTGAFSQKAGESVFQMALEQAKIGATDIKYILATGYGRKNIPFANAEMTEISCHARGAHKLFPDVRTIIDIGGQDSKVIAVNESGFPTNFIMNDKCAAGCGRFLEVMARALETEVAKMGELSLRSTKAVQISSMCTVFAESEVVSAVANKVDPHDIINGIHQSIAKRVTIMVDHVGLTERVMMSGGVAKNVGVVRALETQLETKIFVPAEPQMVGALGAAVMALEKSGMAKT